MGEKLHFSEDLERYLVTRIIEDGADTLELVTFLMAPNKFYPTGCSDTTAYKRIKNARTIIEDMFRETTISYLSHQLALLQRRLKYNIYKGNEKYILEYIKELNKIMGLYTTNLNVTGSVNYKIDFGDENPSGGTFSNGNYNDFDDDFSFV